MGYIEIINLLLLVIISIGLIISFKKINNTNNIDDEKILAKIKESLLHELDHRFHLMQDVINKQQQETKSTLQQATLNSQQQLQNTVRESLSNQQQIMNQNLQHAITNLNGQFETLNQATERRLIQISQTVESKLMQGFEKTNETFSNIIKRLSLIDDAQKKITELSTNVVSLQEILADKSARGAFGEVQLLTLIKNVLPENSFSIQEVLSNGNRADCVLKLPAPTGNVVIDSKFPLENYKVYSNPENEDSVRAAAKQQFKLDLKKHIVDISSKYLIPGETGDGALMFIPAEAVFAEIHSHHPDIVELAYKKRVWMASPSTMMAILTTASAVLKDSATKDQVHIIQEHLRFLAKDFVRFEKRMDNLARHIDQAKADADQVQTSAKKISKRFGQIESVQLENIATTNNSQLLETNNMQGEQNEV